MFRVIRHRSLRDECWNEDDRVRLYRRGFTSAIFDASDRKRISLAGEGWNNARYEFPAIEEYSTKPLEPALTWYAWFPFVSKNRIESEGLSGLVVRERVLDQITFRLGEVEWRYDAQQNELYFAPPPPGFELRHTLLAFVLFRRCRQDS